MALAIIKIADNSLLENSPEGYIIEHTEWNEVMQVIKETINSNADVLAKATIVSQRFKIGPSAGLGYDKAWAVAANGEYYVILNIGSSDAKNIKTYNIELLGNSAENVQIKSEVYNTVIYNDDNTITIKTRNNVPTLVTVQGS